jgi:hypothetical protein
MPGSLAPGQSGTKAGNPRIEVEIEKSQKTSYSL